MLKVVCLAVVVALVAVGGLAPEPAVAAKAKRCRVPSHHAKLPLSWTNAGTPKTFSLSG